MRAFSVDGATAFAAEALSKPPAQPRIRRIVPPDYLALVWQCVLPLTLCPTENERHSWNKWRLHRARCNAYALMRAQHGMRDRTEILPGNPLVLCTRFSASRADRSFAWTKYPVDSLQTMRRGKRTRLGLGFVEDDRDLDLEAWWEPGPPNAGFVLLRVFSHG
jgi:hypothetical protein